MSEKILWSCDESRTFTDKDLAEFYGLIADNNLAKVQVSYTGSSIKWKDSTSRPTNDHTVKYWRIVQREPKKIDWTCAVGSPILFRFYDNPNKKMGVESRLFGVVGRPDHDFRYRSSAGSLWRYIEPVWDYSFAVQDGMEPDWYPDGLVAVIMSFVDGSLATVKFTGVMEGYSI